MTLLIHWLRAFSNKFKTIFIKRCSRSKAFRTGINETVRVLLIGSILVKVKVISVGRPANLILTVFLVVNRLMTKNHNRLTETV